MERSLTVSTIDRIAFIGNYLPRQCGIATFTTDLCEAMATEYSGTTCIALPVNDTEEGYAYPRAVRFELTEKDIDSYHRAADFLNINNVDLVSLQFRIRHLRRTGGQPHLSAAARIAHAHCHERCTPSCESLILINAACWRAVAALSDRLVVMSERGRDFLQEIYHVAPEKIDLIPHGIPDVALRRSEFQQRSVRSRRQARPAQFWIAFRPTKASRM